MEKSAKKKSLSRKYLKILGIVGIVVGVITAILGIVLFFALKGVDMTTVFTADQLIEINNMDISTDMIYVFVGAFITIFGLLGVLEGWLMLRASNDPRKSTLLLVLLVLTVTTAIVNILTGRVQNIGSNFGSIVNLALDVLSLMAVVNARKEIGA